MIWGIRFENDVKTYGTQTAIPQNCKWYMFENDVKTYGTQTRRCPSKHHLQFENDVKTYGTQTYTSKLCTVVGLRMM